MRSLTVFLTLLLALTACATPADNVPPVPQSAPTSVPAKSTIVPAEPSATASPIRNASFETSLLASEWRGGSEGIFLFPLDPTSGIALPGYKSISLGKMYSYAFSPEGRTLAAITYPSDYAYNGSLLLVDLSTWKTRRFELDLDGWVSTMAFSPDGKRLAVGYGESIYNLTIIDIEQGSLAAQSQVDAYVTRLKFTESGKALMLYTPAINAMNGSSAAPPQALLLDAADLSPHWSAALKDIRDGIYPTDESVTSAVLYEPGNAVYLSPGLTFAPDRNALYIVHADSAQLTTVDFENQRVQTVEIQTRLTWFERLLSLGADRAHAKIADGTSKQAAISPDGRFLYIVGSVSTSLQDKQGNWQIKQTPLGLEIVQTSDGSRVEHIETDAAELSLSPDGRFLYLRNWANDGLWTEIFATSSWQLVARKEGLSVTPALQMNGELLLVSTYSTSETSHHMSVLEPDSLNVLTEWTAPDYISWLTTP